MFYKSKKHLTFKLKYISLKFAVSFLYIHVHVAVIIMSKIIKLTFCVQEILLLTNLRIGTRPNLSIVSSASTW